MLPASDIADIISSLASLKLESTTAAAVLAAVLAPLMRSANPEEPVLLRPRAERPQVRPRRARALRRKRKKARAAPEAAATNNQRVGGAPIDRNNSRAHR